LRQDEFGNPSQIVPSINVAQRRHLGNGKFEEISDKIGVEQLWPWGLSVGDLNADGYEDIFITAVMNFPFRYALNSVLLNNRGAKFLDSEFLLGVEPRQTPSTPWFVMDCNNPAVFGASGASCLPRLGAKSQCLRAEIQPLVDNL
jgi:VCBS repeat protein